MNYFDIIVIITIIFSALVGAFRGFTKEIFGLLSWIGAGFFCYLLFPTVRNILSAYISNPLLSDIVSGFSVFLLFFVIFNILSYFLIIIINSGIFGPLEPILGFLFGLLRAVIFIVSLEIISSYFLDQSEYPQVVKESTLSPYIFEASSVVFSLLPEKVQNFLNLQRQKYESIIDFHKNFSSLNDIATLKPQISSDEEDKEIEYSKSAQNSMDRFLTQ